MKLRHSPVWKPTLALAMLSLVAPLAPASASWTSAGKKLTEEQKILHLLNRIGYGPRPGDLGRVKRIGIEKYIEEQLHPERIDDSALEARLRRFESLRMSTAELYEKYPEPMMIAAQLGLRRQAGGDQPESQQRELRQKILTYYAEKNLKLPRELLIELQSQKILRAVYSERQLYEVMVDFWLNHFNVFWGKGADRWLMTDYEMNAIRPHALGKFKDLVMATAKSPAMLFYLDNFQSSAPDAQLPLGRPAPSRRALLQRRARGINENYARELMELHTMGVDGGYTQKDVEEVARCFTGWTIERPRSGARFVFRPWMHDKGEKIVLGHRIPPGGGIEDGEKVIDILVHHPSTARFIATKLVRRFLSDDPPPAVVERVAAIYQKTDGDIRQMLRAILTSKEFFSAQAYRAKVKTPFELIVSSIRALGAETDGSPALAQVIARMGQPLYLCQPPTGYPDRASAWVSAGALLERMNFAQALAGNRIPGTSVDLKRLVGDSQKVLDRAMDILLGGDVSAQTRQALGEQVKSRVTIPAGKEQSLTQQNADPNLSRIIALVLGSPEFQRR
jgi:uncharacterized protein (DUF1800 family)